MPSAPLPFDESARQAELARYAILSTPPEEVFDRITKLTSRLFRCPIVLLSFVDGPRQWFKSCVGIDLRESSRSSSFCAWAILSDTVLVVPDARADPRFSDNPFVTGPVGIRFYAGAPLITSNGHKLGTLCIIDTEPRPQSLTTDEIGSLTDFAALAMSALEARVTAHESEETKDLLQKTLTSIGDGVIVTDAELRVTFLNPAAEELTGWAQPAAIGKQLKEVFTIVDEASAERADDPVGKALAERRVVSFESHTNLLTKDGRVLSVDDSAAPILRGSMVAGGVLIFRDVTKRRASERLLEHSEDQFRRTFAKAPLGLVLTQIDGRFMEANEAYRSITGYTNEELASTNFIFLTHPEEAENNRELFGRLVREEISSYALEKRIVTKGGAIRWVRAHASILRDMAGNASKVIGLVEDITGRKAAEERFRFLAESIPQILWTATPDGMLDYVNRLAGQYFDAPQEALLGSGWLNWVHPDDQAAAVERWSAALRSGNDYETEFRLRRGRDASWRLHLVRALPLIGNEGKISQWFGACTDVENQHQVAQQIEDDRKRWRDLLLQTPAAIAVLRGSDHTFEWVNPGFERFVDRSGDSLAGKTMLTAFPEVRMQGYLQLLDDVYRTGEPFAGHEKLVQLSSANGFLRDCYVNLVFLSTRNSAGDIDGIFVHITDVTSMVNARKTIEQSETLFRTLAETIPHLTWMADETGHIFWYNQRWFNYTGTQLNEMNKGWETVHDPDVLPEVINKWQHAVQSGDRFEMVFPLRGADGEFRPFLTRVEPVRDSTGRVFRWFGTNTDITGQLKIEAELRRINRDLEEFSYVASHDLQEPLRMVNVYTQLLLRETDMSNERAANFAGFIALGVKRMDTLIRDLLTFSRSVHGEELQHVGTADLPAALQEAMGVLKLPIEESGAAITFPELPMVNGDTAQMAHVFQNLLSNALKYKKVDVPPTIHVGVKRDKKTWIISIQDNGIGFDPKYAKQIFGLFKRLHTKEYSGTGLGLAICKRIVERYGGSMWAESAEGQGATFFVSLPAAA